MDQKHDREQEREGWRRRRENEMRQKCRKWTRVTNTSLIFFSFMLFVAKFYYVRISPPLLTYSHTWYTGRGTRVECLKIIHK